MLNMDEKMERKSTGRAGQEQRLEDILEEYIKERAESGRSVG